MVSGWRKDRQDAAIRRNLVSRVANRLISRISGVQLHDYGCTLKAYRARRPEGRAALRRDAPVHPDLCQLDGGPSSKFRCATIRARIGQSKYGLERIVKVMLDLIVVKFLDRHFGKPIYVFGGFGLFVSVLRVVDARSCST